MTDQSRESKPRFFISYNWDDHEVARKLAAELMAAGAEVWVDKTDVRGGDSFPKRISQALEWCNTLLLVWSQNTQKSRWVEREWTSAMNLDKSIVPCLLDETKLPAILSNASYLDFRNFDQAIDELMRSHGLERQENVPELKEFTKPIIPESFKREYSRQRGFIFATLIAVIALLVMLGGAWVFFPELFRKQEVTISETTIELRQTTNINLTVEEVKNFITQNNFFDSRWNPEGAGVTHDFETQTLEGAEVIVHRATARMWQKQGSSEKMTFADAKSYITELNEKNFGGFNDWRLPTLEEALSLLQPQVTAGLHLADAFERTQAAIWSGDQASADSAWMVSFKFGSAKTVTPDVRYFVRAVRTVDTTKLTEVAPDTALPYLDDPSIKGRFLTDDEVKAILVSKGYYDKNWNPLGKGVENDYQTFTIMGGEVVLDLATGLLWQRGGSADDLNFFNAEEYVRGLNLANFAGFKDWRLPTLEEVMSLMEPEPNENDRRIKSIFYGKLRHLWTADKARTDVGWKIDFSSGVCSFSPHSRTYSVRAVRGGFTSKRSIEEFTESLKSIRKTQVLPRLRNQGEFLADIVVQAVIAAKGFHDSHWNPDGKGIEHKYQSRNEDGVEVVLDQTTGLMWQQAGSSDRLSLVEAEEYLHSLNANQFAGFSDWRLPTLEEAMALLESKAYDNQSHINPIFDTHQQYIWTSDKARTDVGWRVDFAEATLSSSDHMYFVRAVRGGRLTEKTTEALERSHGIPVPYRLRAEAKTISEIEAHALVAAKGFYHQNWNWQSKGLAHQFHGKELEGSKVVVDQISGLMWQQDGSEKRLDFTNAQAYIEALNVNNFAGFHDWRLPTLEETLSLLQPLEYGELKLHPLFGGGKRLLYIWTGDKASDDKVWEVNFNGSIHAARLSDSYFVRAVRSHTRPLESIRPSLRSSQPQYTLRSNAAIVSQDQTKTMFAARGFYDSRQNELGKGMAHEYEITNICGAEVVIDYAAGLMWQRGGSPDHYQFDDAKNYVQHLRTYDVAGFSDWRLPTLEEATSLLQPQRYGELCLSPLFYDLYRGRSLWTADKESKDRGWYVDLRGYAYTAHLSDGNQVRAVRTIK